MIRFPFTKRLPLGVALALVLLTAGWARADDRVPDCFVLSAGVDNYPMVNKLQGCLNDARNTTSAFSAQQGKLFGKVYASTLLDGQATWAGITKQMKGFAQQGQAGDYYVVFL